MHGMVLVEKVGTGIGRMNNEMTGYGLKPPVIEANENWFSIIFKRPDLQKDPFEGRKEQAPGQATGQVTGQDTHQDEFTIENRDRMVRVMRFCEVPRTMKEIMIEINMKDRYNFKKQILHPLINMGRLSLTIPDKPSSRHQRYVVNKNIQNKAKSEGKKN